MLLLLDVVEIRFINMIAVKLLRKNMLGSSLLSKGALMDAHGALFTRKTCIAVIADLKTNWVVISI